MSDEQDKQSPAPADDAPVMGATGETATIPRKGRTATMALALLLLLGLVGWATWPHWSNHVPEAVKGKVASLLSGLPLPPLTANSGMVVVSSPTPQPILSSPSVTEPTPELVVVPAVPPTVLPTVLPIAPPVVIGEVPAAITPQPLPPSSSESFPTPEPTPEPENRLVHDLQTRLDAMEQALNQVREQTAGQMQEQTAQQTAVTQRFEALDAKDRLSAGLAEQVDGLARQVDGLSRQITQLQQNTATASTVLALSERMARLEQTQAQTGMLLLATVQLHSAVQAGRSFAVEWQAVQSLGQDQAAVMQVLSRLEPWQHTGVLPFGPLAQRFSALEPVAIRAGLLPDQDGWWRKTLDHLLSLVVVRREDGSQAGDGVTAFLGRAAEAMAKHDLARAIAEVEAIQDPAAAAVMGPWLEQARIYNQAEIGLSHLTATLLAAVGSTAKF